MTFTRHRWDAWCLGGVLILSLGAIADWSLTGDFALRLLGYPAAGLLLLPARFWIPPGGQEAPEIKKLSKPHRGLILWCVLSLAGVLCILPFVRSIPRYWPAWALGSCAHLAVTLTLARRTDRLAR